MPTGEEVTAVLKGMSLVENDQQIVEVKQTLRNRGIFQRWRKQRRRRGQVQDYGIEESSDECLNSPTTLSTDVLHCGAIVNHYTIDERDTANKQYNNEGTQRNSIVKTIVDDFKSDTGDQKILRAIGRTATVNAAVLLTAATGGAAAVAGYGVGGAITAKRFSDGCIQKDEKEVAKSLAVFGAATGASIATQAITGALLIGVAGVGLPVAAACAFGAGCCSGITAGALSEWTVDGVIDKMKRKKSIETNFKSCQSDRASFKSKPAHDSTLKKCLSDGSAVDNDRCTRITKSRPPTLKRSHSDGFLIGFNKWALNRTKIRRRQSCSF